MQGKAADAEASTEAEPATPGNQDVSMDIAQSLLLLSELPNFLQVVDVQSHLNPAMMFWRPFQTC